MAGEHFNEEEYADWTDAVLEEKVQDLFEWLEADQRHLTQEQYKDALMFIRDEATTRISAAEETMS